MMVTAEVTPCINNHPPDHTPTKSYKKEYTNHPTSYINTTINPTSPTGVEDFLVIESQTNLTLNINAPPFIPSSSPQILPSFQSPHHSFVMEMIHHSSQIFAFLHQAVSPPPHYL